MRGRTDRLRTQYEYQRAKRSITDDVANTLPDSDDGIHIRGPKSGWKNRSNGEDRNPAEPSYGRRRTDMKADHIITKKLVVVTVILVDALYLAGDALLSGSDLCP